MVDRCHGPERTLKVLPDDAAVVFCQESGHERVLTAGDDRAKRRADVQRAGGLPRGLAVPSLDQNRGDDRRDRRELAAIRGRDGPERLSGVVHAAAVGQPDDERARLRTKDIPIHPLCDPTQSRISERPSSTEDRRARNRPIDDLRRCTPRMVASRTERRLRPPNREPVAPRHQEQPLATRRGAVVGCDEKPPLDNISLAFQGSNKLSERLSSPRLDRHVVLVEWAPLPKLPDVFQTDHTRSDVPRPLNDNPCQRPDLFRPRLSTLRSGEVRAVVNHDALGDVALVVRHGDVEHRLGLARCAYSANRGEQVQVV